MACDNLYPGLYIAANQWEGYKEKHDLVVVHCSNEAYNGDEQQEDAHCNDASNDVDTGHQAEALPPCCYCNQQQSY